MDSAEIRKVASLSRLTINEAELAAFGRQLTSILEYVRLLDEVNIDGVAPMPHAVDLQNVFREDLRAPSLDPAAALSNAPKTDGRFFLVPRILEEKSTS